MVEKDNKQQQQLDDNLVDTLPSSRNLDAFQGVPQQGLGTKLHGDKFEQGIDQMASAKDKKDFTKK